MSYLILLISLGVSTFGFANTIEIGSTLPSVEINNKGQVAIVGEKLVYQPWVSNKELGQRLAYVQHLAGRVGVKELNKNLSDAIVGQQVPSDLLHSIIIINSDDSAFGTAWLISSEIKSNKETYPSSTFINDSKGTVAEAWGLPLESVSSLIVTANGEVLFRKDGATTDEDIATVMAILKNNLPKFDIETAILDSIGD
ncbi:MAG: YtfJ family uncharacterized protein [Pseudomonadales bacterium]|jgi:YtfJ family uncharacterized protein